jgi:hypothetical protein
MRSLRLSFALLRVPRLFASLFLIPLLISLCIVGAQLFLTAAFIKASTSGSASMEEHIEAKKVQFSFGRKLLYGSTDKLAPIRVCRWKMEMRDGREVEVPPSPECAPKRLDVAVRTLDPEHFDSKEYVDLFDGNTESLHLCRSCHPDVIIHPAKGSEEMQTDTLSVWGILLLQLARTNENIQEHYFEAAKDQDKIDDLLGDVYLNSWGFTKSARMTGANYSLALVFNVASLVVISLWLALKAHRKVLDYFARNGALLPMVAATGKHSFYSAIWILTIARVGAFLLAAVPATVLVFQEILEKDELKATFTGSASFFTLWMAAIATSFALSTLIASIADLKHRHHLFNFLYMYAPMLLCGLGTLGWAATFFFDSKAMGWIRSFTAAIPVIGMTPVMLSPLFQPSYWVLLVHILLTFLFLMTFLRTNARWFAAHLEEL